MVVIYFYLGRENHKALKFHGNIFTDFEIGASLF